MADNTWDPEVAGTPELLNDSADGGAAASHPGPGSPFADLTAEMRDNTSRMADPLGQTRQHGSSAIPPPLPPPQAALNQPLSVAPPPGSALPSTPAPGMTAPGMSAQGAPAPTGPPSVAGSGWSPLGATPAAPPVRTGPAGGAPRYLPPVVPPHHGVPSTPATKVPLIEIQQPVKSGSRWGWRAFASFAAGGLIAAAGFGAAQLAPSSETGAAKEVSLDASPDTSTTPTTTIPTSARDSGTVPLVPSDVDEPASFVAQNLGPAVVQIETQLGLGSGVIYDDGLILTNNHVVQGQQSVRVKLADGQVLTGTVLGSDVKTDVAVVSVGPGQELAIAQLATGSKAQVGQIAIAIGSPFDLQQSVTAGIVSAVDRPIQNIQGSVVAMIQTDAPINPGNSGGALADRQGRVIGINTSIQTDGIGSTNVGVGFAIPIDTAVRIADLLVAGEPIKPGFLGVRGDEPEGGEAGVSLIEVTPGSAAEGAGLLVGDRVLSLNGAPVTGFFELAGLVVANQAGDTVTLELIRDGELISVDVVLGVNEN